MQIFSREYQFAICHQMVQRKNIHMKEGEANVIKMLILGESG